MILQREAHGDVDLFHRLRKCAQCRQQITFFGENEGCSLEHRNALFFDESLQDLPNQCILFLLARSRADGPFPKVVRRGDLLSAGLFPLQVLPDELSGLLSTGAKDLWKIEKEYTFFLAQSSEDLLFCLVQGIESGDPYALHPLTFFPFRP